MSIDVCITDKERKLYYLHWIDYLGFIKMTIENYENLFEVRKNEH
jgi:hypothetical protein